MKLRNITKRNCLILLALSSGLVSQASVRDTVLINQGWEFSRTADFTHIEHINLPHDFQISQPWVPPVRNEKFAGGDEAANVTSRLSARGFKEMGQGWYRKTITPDASWQGKRVILDFQGIMYVADVYLNGKRIGGTDYGYVGFDIDISSLLNWDKPNELLVVANTQKPENSRWYTGGGIIRDVNLIVTNNEYFFPRHPLYIRTDMQGRVKVQTEVNCYTKQPALKIRLDITDAQGKQVYSHVNHIPFNRKMKNYEYELDSLQLANPHLWSCEDPYLYTAHVTLLDEQGQTVDSICEPFGVRTVEYAPEYGMKLNGKKVILKGIANHHTLGALGAASYAKAIEKRIRLLRDFGYNHIRTSHNPYSEDLLKLCDRYGILVVDELYDKWLKQYCGGRADWYSLWQKDVPEFVKRDRNHPSVIMWSLGNELQTYANLPYNDWGVTAYKLQRQLLQRYDTTRPVTVAMHPRGRDLSTDSLPAPLAKVTDIQAYNYRYMYFPGDGRRFPYMNFYQSEASTSAIPSNWWEMNRDKVIGLAYWGGIDYLGESGGWPAKGWAQGQFDIALEPKPIAYLVRSYFKPEEPLVHIGIIKQLDKENIWNGINVGTAKMDECWNLQPGQKVSLNTYTNADEVELIVNGKSIGTKQNPKEDLKHRNIIRWDNVTYEPGNIVAVAKTDGRVVARHQLSTTGDAVRLVVKTEDNSWKADGTDLMHLRVIAVDKQGRRVPLATNKVQFSVDGPADIIATSTGDITSDESMVATERTLHNGGALVILRSRPRLQGEKAATVTFHATSQDLKPASLKLKL